jgi:prevent-host-death family protein
MPKRRPTTVTMSEARASFAKVLIRAEQGEPVQVTRGGKPVAVIVSIEQYKEGQREGGVASEAFRSFMKTLDRRALRGPDPWEGTRDRSTGRGFSW